MNATALDLHATTDVVDEFFGAGRFLDQAYFDALMDYLVALGVKRLDWLYGYQWTIYPDYPGGFDLLAHVVETGNFTRSSAPGQFEGARVDFGELR